MSRLPEVFGFNLLTGVIMLLAGSFSVVVDVFATAEAEWIQGGGFEQGFGDFEVYRYPRFHHGKTKPVVSRVENEALFGRYSLLLPGLDTGGYRFVFPEYQLVGDSAYKLVFRVRSAAAVKAQVEMFFGRNKISTQKAMLKITGQSGEFILHTQEDSVSGIDRPSVGYRLVLRIMSGTDVMIDDISLSGPGRVSTIVKPWIELTPDNPLGVYGVSEKGAMQVSSIIDGKYGYRIVDAIHGDTLGSGKTKLDGKGSIVNLITDQRGSYWVEVYADATNGSKDVIARRRYAVIDRTRAKPIATRYGIAMEEHGQKTHIDGKLQADDIYRLAAELGAGSVRIFTLVMPDIISANGSRYNFSQIDEALKLCLEYGLEPLVELGPNRPDRIPAWLRTSESKPDTIDLTRGLATKKLKKSLKRTGGKQYLDLAAYEQYLRRVFTHLGDKVRYFEIWNEPGHKFLPEDFLKIARLTRKVQQGLAPHVKLVGYTSTKIPGRIGRQSDNNKFPGYLDAMLAADQGESIDVLSYHSAHAFKFLEEGQDGQEDETGYVELLRNALTKNNVNGNMPIWDTERGIPWTSERVRGLKADSLEVARRLPGIYAASLASGVERLFWFNMASSTSTIAKTAIRYGFFDANLEPMPHLAVYDAITQIIGGSHFVRRLERDDGLKIYFFENQDETIVMAFNWRGEESSFKLEFPGAGYQYFDVMGNRIIASGRSSIEMATEITVEGWPRYLVFPDSRSNQIRALVQDH